MAEQNYTISDIIETYISGDWGNDEPTEDASCPVSCIRGADIVPIYNSEYNNIPLRYISEKSLSNRALQEGDIVIEKSGGSPTQSTGRVVYISKELLEEKKDIVCSNFCAAFRIKPEWDAKYVYYYLQHVYNAGVFFNFEGKTSGLKNLIMDTAFKSITIKKIAIETQRSIATVLSTIESKMAANRAINHYLEEMLNLITSRFIFSAESLEKKKIGEIAEVKAGGDCPNIFSKIKTNDCQVPIYSNGIEKRGLYGFTNKSVINRRCVTVAARGTIGHCERRLYPFVPIIRLLSLIPIDEGGDVYLHQVISGMTFKKNGSVQQQLTVPEISCMEIPYPNKETLKLYNDITSPIIHSIEQNISDLEVITSLRDELLSLLMNGQVSIKQLNNDLASHNIIAIYVLCS